MANKNRNVVQNTRNASKRPGGGSGLYVILGIVIIAGIAGVFYMGKKSPEQNAKEAEAFAKAEAERVKNAGPPQPYIMGDTNAPVKIEEFADYECPSCGQYAVVSEPDVRERIVKAGLASYYYYDFPLPMHHNTQAASNSAACADEQGKFWEMHDQLFTHQEHWGLNQMGGEATDNPKDIFKSFATGIGLNVAQWEKCFDDKKYQKRIDANYGEGLRRNVNSTPTFYINGRMVAGGRSYDEIKAAVDSAAKARK